MSQQFQSDLFLSQSNFFDFLETALRKTIRFFKYAVLFLLFALCVLAFSAISTSAFAKRSEFQPHETYSFFKSCMGGTARSEGDCIDDKEKCERAGWTLNQCLGEEPPPRKRKAAANPASKASSPARPASKETRSK